MRFITFLLLPQSLSALRCYLMLLIYVEACQITHQRWSRRWIRQLRHINCIIMLRLFLSVITFSNTDWLSFYISNSGLYMSIISTDLLKTERITVWKIINLSCLHCQFASQRTQHYTHSMLLLMIITMWQMWNSTQNIIKRNETRSRDLKIKRKHFSTLMNSSEKNMKVLKYEDFCSWEESEALLMKMCMSV